VGPRVGLDAMTKINPNPCRESSPGRPVCSDVWKLYTEIRLMPKTRNIHHLGSNSKSATVKCYDASPAGGGEYVKLCLYLTKHHGMKAY
jgi:hypothetical protein